MTTVILHDGTKIDALAVIRGATFPILYIYLDSLTMAETCEAFDKPPEALSEIYVKEENESGEEISVKTFHGFTWFVNVTREGYQDQADVLRVLLERPPQYDD